MLYLAALDEMQMLQLSSLYSIWILAGYLINSKFFNTRLSQNLHLSWHGRKI